MNARFRYVGRTSQVRHFAGPKRPGLLVALAFAAGTVAVATQERFSVGIDIVRVDALVTAGGKSIAGLKVSDFEVKDNGVVQQIDLLNAEQMPVNAILALDMSGSVAGERLVHLRTAGNAVLDALRPEDRAALVSFSHVVTLGSPLTSDFNRVRQALDRAQSAGSTSLIDATYAGLILSESDTGRGLVIAFSDGIDTASWLTADQVLDIGRRSDAVVYGVSAGTSVPTRFLREMAQLTGGDTVQVDTMRDLSQHFVRVLDEFRDRYLLAFTPRGVSKDGYHRLDVRVKNRDVKIKARPGYLAK
jgi:VWFA-related protein